MLLVVFLFVLDSLVFMGISLPMIQRKVKPNPWYGFRVPKTLSDERIWYAANEFCGRMLFAAGAVNGIAAIGLSPLGLLPFIGIKLYVFACMAVMMTTLIGAVVLSFRYLRKL